MVTANYGSANAGVVGFTKSVARVGSARRGEWLPSERVPDFEQRDEGLLRVVFADAPPAADALELVRRLRVRAEEIDDHFQGEILSLARDVPGRFRLRLQSFLEEAAAAGQRGLFTQSGRPRGLTGMRWAARFLKSYRDETVFLSRLRRCSDCCSPCRAMSAGTQKLTPVQRWLRRRLHALAGKGGTPGPEDVPRRRESTSAANIRRSPSAPTSSPTRATRSPHAARSTRVVAHRHNPRSYAVQVGLPLSTRHAPLSTEQEIPGSIGPLTTFLGVESGRLVDLHAYASETGCGNRSSGMTEFSRP